MAMKSTQKANQGLVLWSDSSKHNQSQTGKALAEKRESEND